MKPSTKIQGHHDLCFHKIWQQLGNWHRPALKESNVWGSNYLNIWYLITLMFKEDIPYLELTYLMQLMVHTINETAIYQIKHLTQHEMAPDTFYILLNIPLKINVSCMKLWKHEISFFIYNFGKQLILKERKQKKVFQLCFILPNIIFVYFCIEKKDLFIAFHDSFVPKSSKSSKHLRIMPFILWLPW